MKNRVEHGMQIVVLDRGFVYVGEVVTDKDWVYVEKTQNIRVWGTEKGLGQLVQGPTSKTVLDPVGSLQAPIRALISLIKVEEKSWKVKEVTKKLDRE